MLEPVLQFSIRNRWLVAALSVVIIIVGVRSLLKLPIDAVPDITNNQVQINTLAPSLSPVEVEKQVTFTIENALAGIPGLSSTRSLSRNGFSQVTCVFEDDVNIYFARQQVTQRLGEARESLPPGVDPVMGPLATGLGEIFMYTVEFEHPHGKGAPPAAAGTPGWQPGGAYLTPEHRLLTSDVELASYLREVQDWIIRPQLKSVRDVAGIDAIGGYVKQYHVQPEPMKLVSYGLTFSEVIEAIEKNNVSTGAGYIEHNGESYLVRATGRLESIDQLASIVVGTRGGVPIRIRDIVSVGGVSVGRELRTGSASENGEEVVVGTAIMLLGANSRTVAAAVGERLELIQRSLPPGIRAKTVLDRTGLVDATIRTVRNNLLEGAALVVVVLLLLLGNVRAALICAAAIPLSMLFTATCMVQSKVSGNLMSLGAIDFGLIVDGAVIIVENCLRRLALRQHELAALGHARPLTLQERLSEVTLASREMILPSVFGQAIIITVYFPILALTGIEGRMFHPMALTVIFALAGAFVLSLTFVPAAVAILIRGKVNEKDMFLIRWAKAMYRPVVNWSLRKRWLVVPAAMVTFTSSLLLFSTLGQEFVPTLDERDLALQALRMPSTSLGQSQAMQSRLERALSAFPEVAFVFSKTGTAELASDPMPPNISDTFVIFKPREQWRTEDELDTLISRLSLQAESSHAHDTHAEQEEHEEHEGPPLHGHKGKLLRLIELTVASLPGQNYEFTQPIQMRFNELISGVRGDVAIKVYGDDFDAMGSTAALILGAISAVPGASDAKVEQTTGLPVLTIDIDREAIARHGLTVHEVQEVVSIAMGGAQAGQVFEGDRRFDLVVRLPDALRGDIESLARLPIPLPADDLQVARASSRLAEARHGLPPLSPPPRMGFIPLGDVASISVADGLNQVSRDNAKRSIVVQCNVRGRDLGSFVHEAQSAVARLQIPSGQWLAWGGQYENLVAAKQRLSIVVPLCFLLIFLLLFWSFRSVRFALLVFSAVPLGLTGGIIALWLRDVPFSISAGVGFIALSGVAVLNGLVMVSSINALRAQGLATDPAILRGCLERLRPVLMTALVASLGFIPMALATGTGAEVQRPLATVVIGGLISSTLLTLVVLPALYRIFAGRELSAINNDH